jgi:hypothetical protein
VRKLLGLVGHQVPGIEYVVHRCRFRSSRVDSGP